MSVVSANLFIDKKGKLMKVMCVFCEGVFDGDTMVCPECKDYKGLMPLGSAITYLELDPVEWADYLGDGYR
jgi:hypothetical protein